MMETLRPLVGSAGTVSCAAVSSGADFDPASLAASEIGQPWSAR